MKTRDLVKLLQELDPEGELEVAVGNTPIVFVQKLPAHYDGRLQTLETRRNPPRNLGDVVSGRYIGSGEKINLVTRSIRDFVIDWGMHGRVFPVSLDSPCDFIVEEVRKWYDEGRELFEKTRHLPDGNGTSHNK